MKKIITLLILLITLQTSSFALAITNVNDNEIHFSGYFKDNELVVSGNFHQQEQYQVTVFNLIGQKMYSTTFQNESEAHFSIDQNLNPGIYLINIQSKNDPGSRNVIKVSKQQ